MAIERRRFVELPGTTKLLAFDADKQDEGSSTLDPAFKFEGISELLRPMSSARTYARTNTLAERTYTRLRYAVSVGHLALGIRFRVTTLARRLGTGITPKGHALFQLVPADAAHANRRSGVIVRVTMPVELGELPKGRLALDFPFSVATPLHLMSNWTGFKGPPEMWAFRDAILELDQQSLLALGRIRSCVGPIIALMAADIGRLRCIASPPERIFVTTGRLKRARNCILHEISAGMATTFNTLADEQTTPPHARRLRSSHPEELRNTANPETAMAGPWSRTRDGFWNDVWKLGNRLRQRQEYFRLMRTPLCVPSAVGAAEPAATII